MIGKLAKIASSMRNDKKLKRYNSLLKEINKLDNKLQEKTDDELKSMVSDLYENNSPGDELLIQAFALCREASLRTLKMKPFDVQIIGGLVLNDNKIAEMKTGEGKTLAASLPIFYRSLIGQQTHLVTANEYLATRDMQDLSPLFEFLQIKAGALHGGMSGPDRQATYKESNVIYGTSNEFAFDYLRDNTSTDKEHIFQEKHTFAIVDEIDSILIDEARMPLLISGDGELDENMVLFLNNIAEKFSRKVFDEKTDDDKSSETEDVILYEKNKDASLTDNGFEKLESILVEEKVLPYAGSLYETRNLYVIERFLAAIRGLYLYEANVDYMVKDNEAVIINQQTGRLEPGKRWSDGLHQTIEAKEGLEIKPENRAIANTTLQNYFRLYEGLSGMTGTATTDAEEFMSVYGLEVVSIPTNKDMIRNDEKDRVYITKDAKMNAILENVKEAYSKDRPILIGTCSVEESEEVSQMLKSNGLLHNVLNAKNHLMEADIIAQAGMPNVITVSTNMAGRGTDIILGGNLKSWINKLQEKNNDGINALTKHWEELNSKVLNSGGLHVIGTSRNGSRRIDNQLQGRAGRQGDPGSSVFFISMEDEIMRLFGGARFMKLFRGLGIEEHECVSHKMVDKGINESQFKIEERDFKMRKELLKYDDVVNIQRSHIYNMRSEWLYKDFGDISEINKGLIEDVVLNLLEQYMPREAFEETWDTKGLEEYLSQNWGISMSLEPHLNSKELDYDNLSKEVLTVTIEHLNKSVSSIPEDVYHDMSRKLMVTSIDQFWHDQIHSIDQLKQGIHLRGYAQKDPLMEFKKEALSMFEEMMVAVKEQYVASILLSVKKTSEANQ